MFATFIWNAWSWFKTDALIEDFCCGCWCFFFFLEFYRTPPYLLPSHATFTFASLEWDCSVSLYLPVSQGLHLSSWSPPIWNVAQFHLLRPAPVRLWLEAGVGWGVCSLIVCHRNVLDWPSDPVLSATMCRHSMHAGFALISLIRLSFTWDMAFLLAHPSFHLSLLDGTAWSPSFPPNCPSFP